MWCYFVRVGALPSCLRAGLLLDSDSTLVGSAFLFSSNVFLTTPTAIDPSSRIAHREDDMAAGAYWRLEGNKNGHFKIIIL